MTLSQGGQAPLAPGEVQVLVLGRPLRITVSRDAENLSMALALVEETFRDMDRAYELRWGCSPTALDTPTWLLMGALNLAHRVVSLEQEANRHTQDLEKTLSRLLDEDPFPDSADPQTGPG